MPTSRNQQDDQQEQSQGPASFDQAVGGATSTDLVEAESTEVAATSREYSTQSQFDQSEVLFPRLRLAQGLTPEVTEKQAEIGQWVLSGYDAEDTVTLVPLQWGRAREYRVKADDGGDAISCRSPNGVQGYGDPGIKCAECPLAEWSDGPNKKRVPPPCTLIYSYVCWSVTHQSLVAVEFRKTSINSAKMLNTMIQSRGVGNFAIKLGHSQQRGPRNVVFVVPQITVGRVSEEDMEVARMMMPGGGRPDGQPAPEPQPSAAFADAVVEGEASVVQ